MLDPFAQTEVGLEAGDDDEVRLVTISREYLRKLEAGERPDRNLILAQMPDLRERASEALDGVELAFSMQKRPRSICENSQRVDALSSEPLGDFRILRELGRGGMGVVYEAVQLSLARNVALKVLPFAAALDDRHRKRFLLEAQYAAQLHHPNIVPVYAVGCERGTHFYAMQLINGRSISASMFDDLSPSMNFPANGSSSTIIARKGEPTAREHLTNGSARARSRDRYRRIATLMAQAADALEYAHSCGIVHRDIKPANLLLDIDGKIWIADFGLAQIATGEHMTQTGDLLGTLRYMSPEQAAGNRGVIDHRADVYSLGATLYEMLTRKPVFDGLSRQELLHQIFNDEPCPPRRLDRTIPEELEIITLKALRQSAGDRYESAQAFGDDLRRFLNEKPILARRPSLTDKTRKWMRRHPSTVLSVLFALVASVISLGIVTYTVTLQKSLTDASFQREQSRAIQAERRLAVAQAAADEMIHMAESELSISPIEGVLRQRLLTSAIKYYQSLIDQTTDDAGTKNNLLATRDHAREILSQLTIDQTAYELRLLQDPSVKRDIGLSKQQMDLLQSKNTSPASAMNIEAVKEREQVARQVLSDKQWQRLHQISVQLKGPPGLRDLVLSGEFDLSPEQTKDIQLDIMRFIKKNLSKQGAQFLLADLTSFESTDFGELSSLAAESEPIASDALVSSQAKLELMKILLKRLTPEQLARWHEITGKQFEAE